MKKFYPKNLLTTLFLLCCAIVNAHDFEIDGIYYYIINSKTKTVMVTYRSESPEYYNNEYSGAVNIPELVNYNGNTYKVTDIGEYAFYGCRSLTSITIPNSVTDIRSSAFYSCGSLTSITIPNSVTYIGSGAFSDCSGLTSITIPNSVKYIESSVFYNCSSLTSITIPSSVTSIGYHAFSGCSSLEMLIIEEGNTVYDSREGCNAIIETATNTLIAGCKNTTIPNSVTSIGDNAFYNCSNLTSITIPNSVTSIGYDAFYGCRSLTSITIPASVTTIEEGAFWCENLKTIINYSNLELTEDINRATYVNKLINVLNGTINNSYFFEEINGINTLSAYLGNESTLTLPDSYNGENYIIGEYAFTDCHGVVSITIPNNVTTIKDYAFSDCADLKMLIVEEGNTVYDSREGCNAIIETATNTLIAGCKNTTIPNSVTSIGDNAFYNCSNLTSITIPNSVTNIGDNAFYNCSNLASITIPSSVTSIGDYAFDNTAWDEALPDGITYVGKVLYKYKGAIPANATIEEGTTEIAGRAFFLCSSLKSITIPNSVTSIGDYAFSNCSSLTSVTIGNSVTYIGRGAFYNCSNLASITIPNSVTSIGYYAFEETAWDKALPDGITYAGKVLYKYKGAMPANATIIVKEGTTEIADYAFSGYSNLAGIAIPNSVTYIGRDAFSRCSGLTSVTIPNSVTNIAYRTFQNCRNLKSITIPNSVTSIGDFAFDECSSLTSITIPNSVTSIGYCAFGGCSGLTSVTIPNSVTSIGNSAFGGCSSLTSVTIPNSVTSIGNSAFESCSGLTSITIPNSVTSIGDYAFSGCRGLTSITIPNSVTSIEEKAFNNCTKLKTVLNYSNLTFTKGATDNGYVAYYAAKVYNLKVENDFAFSIIDGINTLYTYFGNDTEITLPKNYNGENYAIEENAFSGFSSLASITIPNSVTTIGENAFNGCSALKTLYIDNGESELAIAANSFSGCPLEMLHVGRALHYDASNASNSPFYGKETLENITIGDNVATIGKYMFAGCNALKEITFGSGVKLIDDYALNGCNSLETIYTLGMRPAIVGVENFATTQFLNVKLNVPNGSLESYQRADIWEKFWEIQEFDVTGIDDTCASTGEPVIYDLRGNRIAEITEPGIYIVNGKKVVY